MSATSEDPALCSPQDPIVTPAIDPATIGNQWPASRRNGWWMLLAIALATIVVRLALLPDNIGTALDPSGDSVAYFELADGLRHGCGFARLRDGKCIGAEIDRTPGYPLFLASFPNFRTALIVQVALAGVIVFAAGGFVYLNWGIGAALVASALIGLDLPSIVYAAELMTETLFTACFLLATLGALSALNDHPRAQRLRLLMLLAASALLSFGLLTRPIGEFGLAVPAVLVMLVSSDPWLRRLGLQLLLLALPLMTIVGWSIRNHTVSGVAAPSSVGASNLFYYRAGGTMAFASGDGWLGAIGQLGSRPHAELTADAFSIILHHPLAFSEMTAWSMLFVALAPVRTPLNHILGVQQSFPVQEPGSIRLRSALATITASPRAAIAAIYRNEFDDSPMIAALTVLQIVSLIFLWLGVIAGLSLTSSRSYRGACILVLAASAFLLMLLAAGPEGTARLRIPALPFLAMIAGLGWTRLAVRLRAVRDRPSPRPVPHRAAPA